MQSDRFAHEIVGIFQLSGAACLGAAASASRSAAIIKVFGISEADE